MVKAYLRRPTRRQRRVAEKSKVAESRRKYMNQLIPKVGPEDTVDWKEYEYGVLHGLWSQPDERSRYWPLVNSLARRQGTHFRTLRPETRKYMAVVQRLLNEGLVYRSCRPMNELVLTLQGSERLRELAGIRPKASSSDR
jgi:hypothetical protein